LVNSARTVGRGMAIFISRTVWMEAKLDGKRLQQASPFGARNSTGLASSVAIRRGMRLLATQVAQKASDLPLAPLNTANILLEMRRAAIL